MGQRAPSSFHEMLLMKINKSQNHVSIFILRQNGGIVCRIFLLVSIIVVNSVILDGRQSVTMSNYNFIKSVAFTQLSKHCGMIKCDGL